MQLPTSVLKRISKPSLASGAVGLTAGQYQKPNQLCGTGSSSIGHKSLLVLLLVHAKLQSSGSLGHTYLYNEGRTASCCWMAE